MRGHVNGKEPLWEWFWRCRGWGLLGRVLAVLGALEAIGILGLSLVQAEGGLLTIFFILSVMPALLALMVGFALATGFVVSLWMNRDKRPRESRSEDSG